ncbi:MAG TPA: hypothetical protein VNR64_13030 [Vicinamibacterales bacterium]|nr:hypothetical protein [Vicinamibacterales bacterium]
MTSWNAAAAASAMIVLSTAVVQARQPDGGPPCIIGQSLDEAWWTGPMLAPSAGTLPRGHFLIEPYLFDVVLRGRFDPQGTRHNVPSSHDFGSLTYLLYGLTDRVTIGTTPTFFYAVASDGTSSSRPAPGDVAVLAQYRLSQFRPCRRMPTISVNVQETLPSGRFDRLGERPTDGFGSGAYTTTLSIYSQSYVWLPNGRILRMRMNVSQGTSSGVSLSDVSVYGTRAGFRGRAEPGNAFVFDGSLEYSATRGVALAFETVYRRDGPTRLTGSNSADPAGRIDVDSGVSHTLAFAPAVEFSWKSTIGVLVGVRVIAAGRNTASTVTPAVAINIVR